MAPVSTGGTASGAGALLAIGAANGAASAAPGTGGGAGAGSAIAIGAPPTAMKTLATAE